MSFLSKIRLVLFLFFIFLSPIFAQQSKPFNVRHQKFIKGDIAMISNNIVNTDAIKKSPNNSYNQRDVESKLNDESNMRYIDIDDDYSTFSSSSADLKLDNEKNKKIIYAGLYWSATYPFKEGKLSKKQKFEVVDSARTSFDTVKIKLPNQNSYTNVVGELIFDGFNVPKFQTSAPYVMFADITTLVMNSSNPFGTYTIGNIKSTVGKISGGAAAGWSIFFIYEDSTMSEKFITFYDGFAGITKNSLDINFTGFQTMPKGNINAKIACAALEGDFNLKGDQLLFKSSNSNEFVQLSNGLREKSNVFNSSISIENSMFYNRKPNSSNTLGYDSFIMSINNPNNSIIGNNTKEATLQLKTYGDRFFMFFTAFCVEVVKPEKTNTEIIAVATTTNNATPTTTNEINKIAITESKENSAKITERNVEKSQPIIKNNNQNQVLKTTPKITETNKKVRITAIESPSVSIASLHQGYYIIANVFAVPSNATRFIEKLKKKGISANYFINPKNNYRYVYVSNHSDFNAASSYYNSNLEGKYYGDLWIMTVNASPKSDVVFTKKQTKNSAKTAFNYKPKNSVNNCKKERYS
jgi:hypothetical protein